MEQHLRARPELLPAILTTLFEMVLFEDVGNQWSLSRPMLALILVNEDIYLHLQRQIIDAQPADKCGPCPSLRQSRRLPDLHPRESGMCSRLLLRVHARLCSFVCPGTWLSPRWSAWRWVQEEPSHSLPGEAHGRRQ